MELGRNLRRTHRAGVVLDLVLALGVMLVGAFLLYHVGLTFHSILHAAARFFGV
ncbi:MAG: hypothetical protein WB809_02685 [Thermoplasmata archaeon]